MLIAQRQTSFNLGDRNAVAVHTFERAVFWRGRVADYHVAYFGLQQSSQKKHYI